MSTLVAVIASFAVLAAIFVPLERAFPARPQRVFRRDLPIDLCFFAGQYLVFSSAAIFFLRTVTPLLPKVADVSSWPMPAQVATAWVLGDLVVYWFHRACHAVPLLWRFHAVHHSAEELDWVAAHREHPFDGMATQLCMNAPAIMLGVPLPALAGVAVFRGLWAIFVHSNVRLPLGPLRMLFGAPELHHWHHARVPQTKHNFANLAPWLDVLFGTYHCPRAPERYPLGLVDKWPRNYIAQLLKPFRMYER
jgi:sterol desaturase/sphingolipid hydroxylase (fatty acid hydroxylase superfamily)